MQVLPKYYYVNATLYGTDNVLNRGPEAAMSYVESKLVNAAGKMAKLLATDMYLDGQGTNSTSIQLDGQLRPPRAVTCGGKLSLIDSNPAIGNEAEAFGHGDRLSERAPQAGDATVGSHGNRNRESGAEMIPPVQFCTSNISFQAAIDDGEKCAVIKSDYMLENQSILGYALAA